MTYFNSESSRSAGVDIAIRLCADIDILDTARDTTIESPSNKLKKNGKKYEDIKEVLTDVHGFYKNIFKFKKRPSGVSIEKFLGDLKDRPEVLKKNLSEAEKLDWTK